MAHAFRFMTRSSQPATSLFSISRPGPITLHYPKYRAFSATITALGAHGSQYVGSPRHIPVAHQPGNAVDGSRAYSYTCFRQQKLSLRSTFLAQRRPFCRSATHHNDTQPSKPDNPKPILDNLNKTSPSDPPTAVPKILQSITPPILHENIYTLPNFLTTTRVITAPIISYALLHSQPVLAFSLFAYSSITDLVDGWLARRYNSGTVLGSILDPFADKLLMTLTTISLYSIGTFPWWLALTILGRDGGLLLSALYFRWISLPPPRTMRRYWDFSLPSAEVRPTEISKINTLLQFLLVADAVLLPVLPVGFVEAWNLWGVLEGWMGLVAATTVWSGLSYIFAKDAIRFIGKDQRKGK